ncbi:hypothetical protein ACLB2K_019357 [Fragaria x ananassa]
MRTGNKDPARISNLAGYQNIWTKSSSRAARPRHPSWAKKATSAGPNAIQNLSRVLDRKYPLGSNITDQMLYVEFAIFVNCRELAIQISE